MKRSTSLLTLAALCSLSVPGRGQVLFHDDFQLATGRFSVADMDSRWILYDDGYTPADSPDDLSHFDKAWKVFASPDGNRQAASVSYFTEPGNAADRWMVSPQIDLASTLHPVLVFRARRMNSDYRDGFEVRLSLSGREKDDFGVSLQKTNTATTAWICYRIDLSEYAGKAVHIAFVQNSTDKYMVCVDDVAVLDTRTEDALLAGLSAPGTVVMQETGGEGAADAVLLNTGSADITSYTLCRQLDDETVLREEVTGVSVESGKTLPIKTSMAVNAEGSHTLSVWVEKINGGDVSSNVSKAPVYCVRQSSLPRKNLLLEMFSSLTCSNCRPLNAWVHPIFGELNANDPGNGGAFSVVKYQVNIPSPGDITVTPQTLARASRYGVSSAPSVYLNGRVFHHNDTTIGRHLRDSIAKFRQTAVPTGLSASLEREGSTFRLHARVTSYLPDENDYNLVVCLIEDSIHMTATQPNGEKDLYNVVRQMVPDVTGEPVCPETVGGVIEKEFEYTFGEGSPTVYSSLDNMGAVVFLQSQRNNAVTQAFYLKPGFSTANAAQKPASRRLSLYPNPVSDLCTLVFDAQQGGQGKMQLIDGQGRVIRSENISLQTGLNTFEIKTAPLVSGFYFVRICNGQGVFTHKMMKR
ncbi:MAG: choice-of-anchor J domain-containing protein [Bacteroides sp.]|nr:choice-of-anchor J domain-containing protein [Bacteroides sp.]